MEYGCADGIWLEYLARNNPDKTFIGVEWNEAAHRYAVTRRQPGLDNLSFRCEDMSEPPGVVECDLCWSLGGIEHFSESARVLTAWVRRLSPGGHCFLTTPNLLNRPWITKRHGLQPEHYLGMDQLIVDTYGYAEIWAPNHFLRVAIDAGLEVVESGVIACLAYEKPNYLIGLKRRDKREVQD